MQTRIIETADGGSGRMKEAVRSVARWYRTECEKVERELANLPQESEAPEHLSNRLAELQRGRENSSVLRYAREHGILPDGIKASERRVGLTTPVGRRSIAEARETQTTSTMTATRLTGHAAVFNQWTEIGGWFRERIAPGAFASAIKTSDVRFLFNHDSNFIYGRNTAATLELTEDKKGLAFTCYLLPFDGPSYQLARRIDRGDISGCSFSFTVKRDSWKLATKSGEIDERTIEEIDVLYDVCPVVYPAYKGTDVAAVFEDIGGRSSAPAPQWNGPSIGKPARVGPTGDAAFAEWKKRHAGQKPGSDARGFDYTALENEQLARISSAMLSGPNPRQRQKLEDLRREILESSRARLLAEAADARKLKLGPSGVNLTREEDDMLTRIGSLLPRCRDPRSRAEMERLRIDTLLASRRRLLDAIAS